MAFLLDHIQYLRAPGLISRALAMAIERAPRSQFWTIILATNAGAFAPRRLNSLDEMGSGTIFFLGFI